jgi:hypothetical protein
VHLTGISSQTIGAFGISSGTIALAAAAGVVFALSLWLAIVIWTWIDIRSRSRDPVIWVASTLAALVPIAGQLVYLILRPRHSLMEAYVRSLEEEALLQEIEERPVCPSCRHRVAPDYIICPNGLTKLKAQCLSCKRLIEMDWNVCPYCATDRKFPRAVGSAEQ